MKVYILHISRGYGEQEFVAVFSTFDGASKHVKTESNVDLKKCYFDGKWESEHVREIYGNYELSEKTVLQ